MAGGWSKDGGVQEQIDQTVADAVKHARSQINHGASLSQCEACGEDIPLARQQALPGVRLCVPCQEELDADAHLDAGFNRRGSKDSQLR